MSALEFRPAAILAELEADLRAINEEEGSRECLAPSIPLVRIETLPHLFQVRELCEEHVEDIAKSLAGGDDVPALLVLQVGHRVVLLDGHHRLEAYKRAKREKALVEVFEGAVEQAVLAACFANSVTKLPMTAAERQDAAWRYVLLGRHSKAQIAKASGASTSTVANMRKVASRLGEEAFQMRGWSQALSFDRSAGREDQTEEMREEWIEATAKRYADTMALTFSAKLTKNPEIAARALAIHFGRRVGELAAHLREFTPDEAEEADY